MRARQRPLTQALVALGLLAVSSSACGTLPNARPLDPGEHELGLSLGGPMVRAFGVIPVPMANLEARSGIAKPLDRALDLNYGVNLTPIAFGVLQSHVGATWTLINEDLERPAVPVLAAGTRVFWAVNAFGQGDRENTEPHPWGANELNLMVSWELKRQLIYFGAAQYTDFRVPSLMLTPVIGASFDLKDGRPGGLKLNLEARWYAINRRQEFDAVEFAPKQGALGVFLGVAYQFGKESRR